jgi:SH3-like domain-containing protein
MSPQGSAAPRAAVIAAVLALILAVPAHRVAAEDAPAAEPALMLRPLARPATPVAAAPAPTTTPDPAPLPASAPAPSAPGGLLPAGPALGPETNLPLPRFVSLKTGEGNARRGPSLSHRIDWVFLREDMPLMITAEYGHWRRVVDREGLGGWVHYSLLSGSRTVIVDQDMLPLHIRPDPGAPEVARLEQGVIARLGRCDPAWCRLSAGGYRGWAPKTALWGVGADEILD